MLVRRLAELRPILEGNWLAAAANTKGGVIAYPSPLTSRQQLQTTIARKSGVDSEKPKEGLYLKSQGRVLIRVFRYAMDFTTAKQYAPLPKLPVPDPRTTLKHFLDFAKPLQSKNEYQETESIVNNFVEKELPTLQKLLEQRASKLNNWLTPWWLNVAYLEARTPLPIITSPGLMFPLFPSSGKDTQIDHAAKITQAAIEFYLKIMRNEIPQDMAGKTPFDMSQYKFICGTTRIPRKGCDEIRYGYTNENQSKHIVAIHNGHIFSMPVTNAAGQPLSLSALSSLFSDIIKQSPEKQQHAIGIVSSDKRDRWAEIYEELKGNPKNSSHLSCIEDALFVVCLDQGSEPPKGYSEKDEQARQCLHGGGTRSNSCNRWFDKTLQFVIGANGACGLTYEHTPAEGPPVAAMMDFICDKMLGKDFRDDSSVPEGKVKRLDFELSEAQIAQIEKSGKNMDRAADDVDIAVYVYKRFGKNYPKSVGISPDSFIQMAFQLAFFRIHSALPPTYETATLRKFEEGRTENIRSPNALAETFVRKMAPGNEPVEEVYQALKAAAESHKKYTMSCMSGAGMDRHLLAWKLLAAENGLPKPSILDTPAYEQMCHFQVSTSQVPTRNYIQLCFGPSAPDCYGICYNPQETEVLFTVTSFKSYLSTSSKRFARELERAFNDMNSVCNKALRAKSKL